MSNLAYFPLADDLIEDLSAVDITIITEDANYPKTKIQNIPMADTARATEESGGMGTMNFDSGSVRPTVGEVLEGHDSGATARVLSVTWGVTGSIILGECDGCFNDDEDIDGDIGGADMLTVNHPDGAVGVDKIVKNGAFVHDIDPPNNWTEENNVDCDTVAGGMVGNCAKVLEAGANNPQIMQEVVVEPGKTYKFTFYHNDKDATDDDPEWRLHDQTNGVDIKVWTAETAIAAWTLVTYTFEAPALCVAVRIYLRHSALNTDADAYYFDEVTLYEIDGYPIKVQIDLGSDIAPRFWAFLNHNIESGNWLIRSYDDAFITLSGESQTVTYREYDTKHYYTGWTAKRYWEIDFNGCTFKNDFWEMGKILCGADITEFTKQFSPGIRRGLGFDNIHNETEFGVIWSYIKRARIQYLGVSWDPHLRVPLLAELEDFIETTYGGAYPSIIIPDNSGRADLYYMKNQDELRWNEELTRAIIAGCHIDFKELSRGQVQVA